MRTIWLVLPAVAAAAPFTTVHQGRLTDPTGQPYEGDTTLRVRLYDGSDHVVFEDVFTDVPLSDGYFSVTLGSGAPLDSDDLLPGPLYVGLKVGTDPELPLRTALHATPYAALATSVRLGNQTTCDADHAGMLRWDGSLGLCDGTSWLPILTGTPGSATQPVPSCKALHTSEPGYPSGTYYLDPNGGSPADAFPAYCEMTVAGGGWTRVATFDGTLAICSLADAYGTVTDLAAENTSGHGTGNAWMSAAQVSTLPFTDEEVLTRVSDTVWERFTSTHASWTWTNVANGTINTKNVGNYAVQALRSTDGSFVSLGNATGCNQNNGCLLGGYRPGGSWNDTIIGIGSHSRGSFTQDASCQSTAAPSNYLGTWKDGWQQAASIYIR